ncbi:hypothetical protein GOB91_12010 [Sinorhizobium meliloti]|nr:hypothetical protein [Sinorhizobium meliloti]MDW9418866.1 hypothetical protein [Sinorhizobium meliloti]MDW9441168.1 hypothetical protein [Sinorhizobium meliloti]MDW9453823.1 hypothetical protein [Sinorhizobium meliloti]MDW9466726.1 hypothetical protein [Sinorhizobium meliloti]
MNVTDSKRWRRGMRAENRTHFSSSRSDWADRQGRREGRFPQDLRNRCATPDRYFRARLKEKWLPRW